MFAIAPENTGEYGFFREIQKKSSCSFRSAPLESLKTTWFAVSYREWLREGPVEATATGRTFAMLVLTPPGISGRDKIVRGTSLVLYSYPRYLRLL